MRELRQRSEGPSRGGSIERAASSCLVRGDRRDRWPFHVDDVVYLEVEPVAAGRDELHREVRLLEEVGAARFAHPLDGDLQDLEAHLREVVERLIPVDALFHVDLSDRAEPYALQGVDEKTGLDPVAREERQLLAQRSPAGLLAREGLHDPGKLRKEQVEDRASGELGHAPAAGRLQLVADAERTLVERFHELQVGPHEERADDAVHELRMSAGDVGVDPDDDVAGEDVEALPEGLALTAVAADLGKDLVVDDHSNALVLGDLAGPVFGARVDDDHLVHERNTFHEARTDRADDLPDRRLLVECWQADRDALVLPLLRVDEALDALVVGALAKQLVQGLPLAAALLSDVKQRH